MSDAHEHPHRFRAWAEPSAENPKLDARILQTLVYYVVDHAGQDVLNKIIQNAGIDPAAFEQKKSFWLPLVQVEAFLQAFYALVDSDDERFKQASAYRIAEALGPFRFVNRAFSPLTIMSTAFKSAKLVTTFGRGEIIGSSPRHIQVRYHTRVSESRLMCLNRQAMAVAQPTLWGLPPATLSETKCICWGDPYCEHTYQWYVPRRPWMAALGATMGFLGAGGASLLGWVDPLFGSLVLPAVGLLAFLAWESARANRLNLRNAEEQTEVVRHFIQEDAEARRELLSIQERQNVWHKRLEQQKEAYTAQLESLLDSFEDSQTVKDDTARGLSHDLRSPLGVIQMTTGYLAKQLEADPRTLRAIEDIRTATSRMEGLLSDFIRLSQNRSNLPELNLQLLKIDGLRSSLQRRLVALTLGNDVLPFVAVAPSAPDTFSCDPQLFDRILDNLLANAAKYTNHGSIHLQFEGSGNDCIIVLADSGCGMAPEHIKQAFLPGGTARRRRAPDSHGLGLSVTLQLLGQIGGRLEIASAPNKGTTLRVHFPLDPNLPENTSQQVAKRIRDPEQLFHEIVHVIDPQSGLSQL